jgi:gamma-glutamyltranspeptidase/glutathione hydrolase
MGRRQTALATGLAAALALAGCGGGGPEAGDAGFVEGFYGGVMADEPRAALVGRETLSAGGTAADAAVAAYFTMAVTLPGGAGLGGGGVCVAFEPTRKIADSFEFLPGTPASGDARFAVPGNVRGMFAVHARYGTLNWSSLLLAAERLARDGHPISRAFARDLDAGASALAQHPDTARAFGVADGPAVEATPLQQIALSAMLSAIRVRGPGDFYQGTSARQFVDAVGRAGGSLTLEDMRAYLPRLQEAHTETSNNETIFIAGGAGDIAARVWAMLKHDNRYAAAADDGARAHLLAAASVRAYAAARAGGGAVSISREAGAALMAGFDPARRASAEPEGQGGAASPEALNGASLVVVDRFGQVVACGYTMGRPFGSGVIAPGTGILLAPADTTAAVSRPAALAVVNLISGQTFLGAAIGGGPPVALAALPLDVRARDVPMDTAIAVPRLYDPAQPDTVFHEPEWSAGALAHLENLGYRLKATGPLGRINGFHCPDGLPRTPVCRFVNDPRGYGLSVNADQ